MPFFCAISNALASSLYEMKKMVTINIFSVIIVIIIKLHCDIFYFLPVDLQR